MKSETTTVRSFLWLMWLVFGIGFATLGVGSGTMLGIPLLLALLCFGLSSLIFFLDAISVSKERVIIRSLMTNTVIPTSNLRRLYQVRKDTLFLVFEYVADDGAPRTRRVLAMPFLPRLSALRQSLVNANPQIKIEI